MTDDAGAANADDAGVADTDGGTIDPDETTVRIRGIYTTALTRSLRERGYEIVQASPPIRDRFDGEATFAAALADVSIETSRDRQGVAITGDPEAVAAVAAELESVAIDTFRWPSAVPERAVFDAVVRDSDGGGAVVDLGDGRRGYLPYDAVDEYVDAGNRYRVQVHEPVPPWTDDEPLVRPALEIDVGLCTLSRGGSGVSAAVSGERAAELVGMTDLLSTTVPDGWGLRWNRAALDAGVAELNAALDAVISRVDRLETALESAGTVSETPRELASPLATTWCWFGRESRFELDGHRRAVETTLPGHHRIKATRRSASAAVDFAEAICASVAPIEAEPEPDRPADGDWLANGEFPFAAVTRQFGPQVGDSLEIGHGKPDGRYISLGEGTVTDWDRDGSVTLERSMHGGGTYDALGVPKEEGDVAVTKLREGRWWYPTTYRDADGDAKGTYVNVCTPVELFPGCARYVDLYVDVIRRADGTVDVVDREELATAVDEGLVSEELGARARQVAAAVERALSK